MDKKQLVYDMAILACRAAVKYDEAIRYCSNEPDKMATLITAQGETLDDLYMDWMMKARAVLAEEPPP